MTANDKSAETTEATVDDRRTASTDDRRTASTDDRRTASTDDRRTASTDDRRSEWRATRPGTAIVVTAVGVAVAVAAATLCATAVAVAGALALLAGVAKDHPSARRVGALVLLAAALGGVASGLSTVGVLGGTTAVVVAYDAGERTTELHAQTPTAKTGALETRRAAWTLAACALAATGAVAVAHLPSTNAPGGAALALVGGVLVALALRDTE